MKLHGKSRVILNEFVSIAGKMRENIYLIAQNQSDGKGELKNAFWAYCTAIAQNEVPYAAGKGTKPHCMSKANKCGNHLHFCEHWW